MLAKHRRDLGVQVHGDCLAHGHRYKVDGCRVPRWTCRRAGSGRLPDRRVHHKCSADDRADQDNSGQPPKGSCECQHRGVASIPFLPATANDRAELRADAPGCLGLAGADDEPEDEDDAHKRPDAGEGRGPSCRPRQWAEDVAVRGRTDRHPPDARGLTSAADVPRGRGTLRARARRQRTTSRGSCCLPLRVSGRPTPRLCRRCSLS